jgi:hypothetical protein
MLSGNPSPFIPGLTMYPNPHPLTPLNLIPLDPIPLNPLSPLSAFYPLFLGDKAGTIDAFRKSLTFHPWINHVP